MVVVICNCEEKVCLNMCYFGANRLLDGRVLFNPARCYGCSLCISTCPTEARRLAERIGHTNLYYPSISS